MPYTLISLGFPYIFLARRTIDWVPWIGVSGCFKKPRESFANCVYQVRWWLYPQLICATSQIFSIRESAGQTSKSSISYTYTFDNRNDRITGTRGFHTKLFQEFAGLGGDASYFKAETENHISRSVLPGLVRGYATFPSWTPKRSDCCFVLLVAVQTVALSACSGLLWSFSPTPSLFPDRFQLGGPLSVRSMRFAGLGPRDGCMFFSFYTKRCRFNIFYFQRIL